METDYNLVLKKLPTEAVSLEEAGSKLVKGLRQAETLISVRCGTVLALKADTPGIVKFLNQVCGRKQNGTKVPALPKVLLNMLKDMAPEWKSQDAAAKPKKGSTSSGH